MGINRWLYEVLGIDAFLPQLRSASTVSKSFQDRRQRTAKQERIYYPALRPWLFPHICGLENSMHWLWVVLIGLVVGALAKLIMPGKDPGGFVVTILLGIAGSVIATWIGRAIGWYREGQSAGFIMSLLGAILLLALYHAVKRRSA
jgi:uncharacterized membrane protein YeaQ/YmgE (transglycosylase-associated protein family)